MSNDILVWGEMLVDVFPDSLVAGGAPFNVAQHLHSLGQSVVFASSIGSDEHGKHLNSIMQARGMQTHGVSIHPDKPTGKVIVSMNDDGHHAFTILQDQAWDKIDQTLLSKEMLDGIQMVYFGSIAQRSTHNLQALMDMLSHTSACRFYDLNWRNGHLQPAAALALFEAADIVKLSEEELNLVLHWYDLPTLQAEQWPVREGMAYPMLRNLLNKGRAKKLLCTFGSQGSSLIDSDGRCLAHEPASHVPHIVDTVGAGDAFSACAIDRLARGRDSRDILRDANGFAGKICQIRGAVPQVNISDAFYAAWRIGH